MKPSTRYKLWSDIHEGTEPFIILGVLAAITLLSAMIIFGVRYV